MSFVEDDPLHPQNELRQAEAIKQRSKDDAALLEQLRHRQESYRRIFRAEGGLAAIDDLKRFCRADQSAYHEDERTHVLITGRQEVWLRIQEYITLPFDELVNRRR